MVGNFVQSNTWLEIDLISSFNKENHLLESLELCLNMGVECLVLCHNMNCMHRLRYLYLLGCKGLKQVCIWPGILLALECLSVEYCKSLEHLSILECCFNLRSFIITSCNKLVKFSICPNNSQPYFVSLTLGSLEPPAASMPLQQRLIDFHENWWNSMWPNNNPSYEILEIRLRDLTSLRYIDGIQYLPCLKDLLWFMISFSKIGYRIRELWASLSQVNITDRENQ
jgi:hypothetical protein